jgi:hypothetical protein
MRGDHMALLLAEFDRDLVRLRGSAASGISAACASFAVSIADQPPLRLQQATTRMFQVMAAVLVLESTNVGLRTGHERI